jgi:N-acyl amino acid synthase of PEP-CTERM/exosortase system
MRDLATEFDRRFEVVHVTTPEQRRELFRLRYRVFCSQLELPGFEPWRYPNGEEMDQYDARSVHCVLRHRPTGSIAGAVRLVLSDPADQEVPFPLETHCTRQLGRRPADLDAVPRTQVAEISRLFVARDVGREAGTAATAFGYPILGLFRAVVEMSAMHGVTRLYSMMEPQLNRLLRAFCLNFDPIGPVIDCHGRRQPHAGDLGELSVRVRRERPEAWAMLTRDVTNPPWEEYSGVPSHLLPLRPLFPMAAAM